MAEGRESNEIQELDNLFNEHFGIQLSNDSNEHSDEDTPYSADEDNEIEEVSTDAVINNFLEHQSNDDQVEEPFIIDYGITYKNCGCENKCTESVSKNDVIENIFALREMTKNEKEQLIMTVLNTVKTDDSKTCRGPRKRPTFRYSFAGRKICRTAFMIVYDINDFTLRAIASDIQEHGVSPRKHGNTGRKPAHALTYDDVMRVVNFLRTFSEENGLPQPAAPRGRDNIPPVYLHSSFTRKSIHSVYVTNLHDQDVRRVKLSAFCQIWQACLPHIVIASPRHDVCAKCEKCRKKIMDAVTDDAKLEATTHMQQHLEHANEEKAFYNDMVRDSKAALTNLVEDEAPLSMHYTFDFAQNVCLPHHSRQMGPLYFLTLKKVQVFGFRSDGEPRQLIYLFDEGQSIGIDGKTAHGPDAVISMVHHGLDRLGKGERICSLHADNCAGQNKNRYVIAYLIWRVMSGLHDEIQLHMQIPGHSRCLVDAGFANFKRLYKRCDADCMDNLQDQVNRSSTVNEAVLYPRWHWYKWKDFLTQHFKPMRGISSYQHFRVTRVRPGEVLAKKRVGDEELTVQLLRDPTTRFEANKHPDAVDAAGLSQERRAYLYRHVRPYVRAFAQEVTCPSQNREE